MADLTAEQFEQLPEFVRGDYEKNGDVYRPVAEGKLSALKGSLDHLDKKYKDAASRIEEIERGKAAEIEAAKEEALKKARTNGDVAAIEKRYQEQMEDLQKRSGEKDKQYEDRIAKLSGAIKSEKRTVAVGAIAKELNIVDGSEKLFAKLISDRIDIDPETGKETYLDENGGATSLDRAGFIAELAKDSAFDVMRKASVATSGIANGNNGNGGGALKKPHEYTEQERVELFRRDPAKFQELFPTS